MNLEPLEVKTDNRGALVEAFKLPNDGQVFYLAAKSGETRGNHYHLRKTERFLVVSGRALMVVKDRDTDNIIKTEVSGANPMLISVSPNHTHNITAIEGDALILVWVSEQFNADDPDTYPEEI